MKTTGILLIVFLTLFLRDANCGKNFLKGLCRTEKSNNDESVAEAPKPSRLSRIKGDLSARVGRMATPAQLGLNRPTNVPAVSSVPASPAVPATIDKSTAPVPSPPSASASTAPAPSPNPVPIPGSPAVSHKEIDPKENVGHTGTPIPDNHMLANKDLSEMHSSPHKVASSHDHEQTTDETIHGRQDGTKPPELERRESTSSPLHSSPADSSLHRPLSTDNSKNLPQMAPLEKLTEGTTLGHEPNKEGKHIEIVTHGQNKGGEQSHTVHATGNDGQTETPIPESNKLANIDTSTMHIPSHKGASTSETNHGSQEGTKKLERRESISTPSHSPPNPSLHRPLSTDNFKNLPQMAPLEIPIKDTTHDHELNKGGEQTQIANNGGFERKTPKLITNVGHRSAPASPVVKAVTVTAMGKTSQTNSNVPDTPSNVPHTSLDQKGTADSASPEVNAVTVTAIKKTSETNSNVPDTNTPHTPLEQKGTTDSEAPPKVQDKAKEPVETGIKNDESHGATEEPTSPAGKLSNNGFGGHNPFGWGNGPIGTTGLGLRTAPPSPVSPTSHLFPVVKQKTSQ